MQSLDLNLATRPFKNNTLLWVGYGAAVAVLVLFSVWNVRTYGSHRSLVGEIKANQAKIDTRMAELGQREVRAQAGIRRHDLKSLLVKSNKANEVINWKAFSWTRLFNRMEAVQPWNVKMLSIVPMFRGEGSERGGPTFATASDAVPVVVEGMAQAREGLWDFAAGLFDDPYFANVNPRTEGRLENSPEVMFTLRFDYYPHREVEPEVEAEEQAEAKPEADPEAEPAPKPEAQATAEPEPEPEQAKAADDAAEPVAHEVAVPQEAMPAAVDELQAADAGEQAAPAPAEKTDAAPSPAETADAQPAGEEPEAAPTEPRRRLRPGNRRAGKQRGRARSTDTPAERVAPDGE